MSGLVCAGRVEKESNSAREERPWRNVCFSIRDHYRLFKFVCPIPSQTAQKDGACRFMFHLKRYAQRKLHDTRIAGERCDAGRRAAGDVVARLSELRSIGYVEDFPAGFDVDALDGDLAHQRGIKDVGARADERIASTVAELSGWRSSKRIRQVRREF